MEVPAFNGHCYANGGTQQATNTPDRNLARAERDQQTMLRREGRQFEELSTRFANDAGAMESFKKHREVFETSMNEAYEALVSRGGQGYAEYAQTLVRLRNEYRNSINATLESQGGGTTTGSGGGVDTRNLDRARHDLRAMTRGVEHEFHDLRERFGASEELDKLQKDFSSRVDAEFQSFVTAGAGDYMGFAERLAALRLRFRDEVRAYSQGVSPTNTNGGGTTNAGGSVSGAANASTTTKNAANAEPTSDAVANERNLARAQRDRDALTRGIDREIDTLTRRVGDNPDAIETLKKMRDEFLAAMDQRLTDFRAGGGQDYMGFASASASARLDLTRHFQAIYQSAGPGVDTKA